VGESQRNLWLQAGHLKYTDTKPLTLLTSSDSSRATATHHTNLEHTRGLRIGPSLRAGLSTDRGYNKT